MSTLTYTAAWRTISARIHGIEKAAEVHASFLAVNSASPYGADKSLQIHCEQVLSSVEQFQTAFGPHLPAAATEAIDRFLLDAGQQIRQNASSGGAMLLRTIIVKLVAFESEMTFCLDSPTERIRSASELAFMHLQRLIVADEEYREKWQNAYKSHETHCETLGATHLLWHGIWAFKADSKGGKTDLVYQEPLVTGGAPVALGMVLTEWKRDRGDSAARFQEALHQAKAYGSGILAGVELATHRYLVVVTQKQCTLPADINIGQVTYRHINIAVDPDSPSVAAKKPAV